MEFVHTSYYPGETIAAIATPPGEGGVAIIRISGNQALDVAARVFSGPVHKYRTHSAHFCASAECLRRAFRRRIAFSDSISPFLHR